MILIKLIAIYFVLIISQAVVVGQEKTPSSGNFDVYQNFETNLISPRTVRVWTPKDYSPKKKYAVLYMHDAQNIFGVFRYLEWSELECRRNN